MNYWLLLVPVLTAFTGWICMRLLVWSVFRPLLPKNIAGIPVQGLLPKHKTTLAAKLGELAATEFSEFSAKLGEQVSEPASVQKVLPLIESHVDDFLRNKLPQQMPMIGMFIGDKTIATMKGIFLKEIEEMFPKVIGQYAGDLLTGLDVRTVVSAKIAAMPVERLEKQFRQQFARQLRSVDLLGILIGLVLGLVQLLIIIGIK